MKTILSLIALYPLLIPIWEKEPLTSQNTEAQSHPYYLTFNEIRHQSELCKTTRDARLRGRTAMALINSNNPQAVIALENMLQSEKNDIVKTDIIMALYHLRHVAKIRVPQSLVSYFSSQNPMLRAYAAALYLDKQGVDNNIIKFLKNEKSDFVNNLLWEGVSEKLKSSELPRIKAFLSNEIPSIRAGTVFTYAKVIETPDSSAALKSALQDSDSRVRASLAKALSLRRNGGDVLLSALSGDDSNTVRGIVASVPQINTLRRDLQIKLTEDKDWETRRLACLSLGGYKPVKEVVDPLLKCFADSNASVRTAAEDSMIKLKPNQSTLNLIAETYLTETESCDASIRVLGTLKVLRFADAIFDVLKNTDSPETIRRAILALSNLKCEKAAELISSFATNKDKRIRQAVALALGELKQKSTFKTLTTLCNDKDPNVAFEALKSIGRVGDKSFNKEALKHCRNVTGSGKMRSAACWTLAKINAPDPKVISWLQTLCSKKVIPAEGMKMYDSDYIRISACLALIDMGRENEGAKKAAIDKIKQIDSPLADAEFCNPTLKEYFRQAQLYMNGEKIEAKPLPECLPQLPIKRLK